MKKLILISGLLITTIVSAADSWTISTTCGVQVKVMLAEDVTVNGVRQAAIAANQSACGTTPTNVTIKI